MRQREKESVRARASYAREYVALGYDTNMSMCEADYENGITKANESTPSLICMAYTDLLTK